MASSLVTLALAAVVPALGLPGARAEVLAVEGSPPAGCEISRAEVKTPVTASGRVVVHVVGSAPGGEACAAWTWAVVRVTAPALVTSRPVAVGEPLADAVRSVEREVMAGQPPLAALPEGAQARYALPAGAALGQSSMSIGPPPGKPVTVILRAGALSVEQLGTAVGCRWGRACALLSSGRRVEGAWHGGRIELDTP